jgi:hypothetical protein
VKAAIRNRLFGAGYFGSGAGEQQRVGAATTAELSTDRLLNQRQATSRARIIEDRRRDCNSGDAADSYECRSAAVVITCGRIFAHGLASV